MDQLKDLLLFEIETDYGSFASDKKSKDNQADERMKYDILTLVSDAIKNQDCGTTGHYEIKFS